MNQIPTNRLEAEQDPVSYCKVSIVMHIRERYGCGTVLFFLVVNLTCVANAQLPDGLPGSIDVAALEADGFAPLFNGQDLTGWRSVNGNGQYRVVDESIIGFGEDINANTFLRTEANYRDFIFAFEFKFLDRAGNSGLMFRANQRPKANGEVDPDGRVFGFQCEHDQNHDRSWTAGLYDEARRDWLFPKKGDEEAGKQFTTQGQSTFKWDDWNVIVIRCEGNHIQTWLNGTLRVDFTDDDPTDTTLEGFFALQVHNGKKCEVAWRNLLCKPLDNR
jgi:hypothetical protein